VGLSLHADCFKDFFYLSGYVGLVFPSCSLEDEREIVLYGTVHKELEVLEHHSHLPSQERDLLVLDAVKPESAGFAFSCVKRILGDDGSDYRGLSCADLSYDIYEVSGIDVHVEVIDYYSFAVDYVGFPERYDRLPFFHCK
jgi:hypothetical protein